MGTTATMKSGVLYAMITSALKALNPFFRILRKAVGRLLSIVSTSLENLEEILKL